MHIAYFFITSPFLPHITCRWFWGKRRSGRLQLTPRRRGGSQSWGIYPSLTIKPWEFKRRWIFKLPGYAHFLSSIKLDTGVCSSSMLVDTLYKIWSGIIEFWVCQSRNGMNAPQRYIVSGWIAEWSLHGSSSFSQIRWLEVLQRRSYS